MPLSRAPRTPDLERVVQVLGGEPSDGTGPPGRARGWVPSRPGGVADLPGHADAGDGAGKRGDGVGGVAELDELEEGLRAARTPGFLTLPATVRSGRITVSSTAVVAVLALVVALACAFVLRILWAERGAAGAPVATATGADRSGAAQVARAAGPSGSAADPFAAEPGDPGAATATAPAEVVVHVVGQVRKPGLVRLRPGARVADAIEAAGGPTSRADLSMLNLARPVVDGEQVVVPRPGEVAAPAPGVVAGGAVPGSAASGSGGGSAAGAAVNLNTADLSALDTLPGVGPVLAQRIVDWRTEHGRFTSVEELGEVSGIGEKMLAQLRPKVTV